MIRETCQLRLWPVLVASASGASYTNYSYGTQYSHSHAGGGGREDEARNTPPHGAPETRGCPLEDTARTTAEPRDGTVRGARVSSIRSKCKPRNEEEFC